MSAVYEIASVLIDYKGDFDIFMSDVFDNLGVIELEFEYEEGFNDQEEYDDHDHEGNMEDNINAIANNYVQCLRDKEFK